MPFRLSEMLILMSDAVLQDRSFPRGEPIFFNRESEVESDVKYLETP